MRVGGRGSASRSSLLRDSAIVFCPGATLHSHLDAGGQPVNSRGPQTKVGSQGPYFPFKKTEHLPVPPPSSREKNLPYPPATNQSARGALPRSPCLRSRPPFLESLGQTAAAERGAPREASGLAVGRGCRAVVDWRRHDALPVSPVPLPASTSKTSYARAGVSSAYLRAYPYVNGLYRASFLRYRRL
jgi:hypothetical protein